MKTKAEALRIAADIIESIEFRSGIISHFNIMAWGISFSFEFGLMDATKETEQVREKMPENTMIYLSEDKVTGLVQIKIVE